METIRFVRRRCGSDHALRVVIILQPAHTGDDSDLLRSSGDDKAGITVPDHMIESVGSERGHAEDKPYIGGPFR